MPYNIYKQKEEPSSVVQAPKGLYDPMNPAAQMGRVTGDVAYDPLATPQVPATPAAPTAGGFNPNAFAKAMFALSSAVLPTRGNIEMNKALAGISEDVAMSKAMREYQESDPNLQTLKDIKLTEDEREGPTSVTTKLTPGGKYTTTLTGDLNNDGVIDEKDTALQSQEITTAEAITRGMAPSPVPTTPVAQAFAPQYLGNLSAQNQMIMQNLYAQRAKDIQAQKLLAAQQASERELKIAEAGRKERETKIREEAAVRVPFTMSTGETVNITREDAVKYGIDLAEFEQKKKEFEITQGLKERESKARVAKWQADIEKIKGEKLTTAQSSIATDIAKFVDNVTRDKETGEPISITADDLDLLNKKGEKIGIKYDMVTLKPTTISRPGFAFDKDVPEFTIPFIVKDDQVNVEDFKKLVRSYYTDLTDAEVEQWLVDSGIEIKEPAKKELPKKSKTTQNVINDAFTAIQ